MEFDAWTGLSTTQNVKLLAWLKERGYPEENLQADTIAEVLDSDGVTADVRRVLEIKSGASFAALAKIDAMLRSRNSDNRVRGTLQFHGAGTGRWSARLVQPQNAKKSTDRSKAGYMLLEKRQTTLGETDAETLSEMVRHFIQPPDGNVFLDADYSQIEARIVAWVAGQEDALQDFRAGLKPYVKMASAIFKVAADAVTTEQKFVGKTAVLGLGYQMGAERFAETCAKGGNPIAPAVAVAAVETYRRRHPRIVELWADCNNAAKTAVANPGKEVPAGLKLHFQAVGIAGIPFLLMRLPSGRRLVYPHIRRTFDGLRYFARDHWKGRPYKRKTGYDGTKGLYGGLLVENAVQAIAFDVMAHGALEAERKGFDIVALIHDQALAETSRFSEETLAQFTQALTALPKWAGGLPLAAEGKICNHYEK
jgi:DNA polymerase